MTYRVAVPAGQTGVKDLSGALNYDVGTGSQSSNTEVTRLRSATGGDTFVSLSRQIDSTGVYFPGAPVGVTLRFEQKGGEVLYGIVGTDTIPAGWTVQYPGGASPPPIWKVAADGHSVEFGWVAVPALPVEFTYLVTPPADASGVVEFSCTGLYRFSGPQLETNTVQTFLAQGYPIR
jgi:hypothetical protein